MTGVYQANADKQLPAGEFADTSYSDYFKENVHLFDAPDFLAELTHPIVVDTSSDATYPSVCG
ncbi:MAG: hypothetical protein KAU31_08280 [Spirochaetaceae bacterium]|nr:hypothetical protein [Spirochaetaceae bacterium]